MKATQKQIDQWNSDYPIGTKCWVIHDDGSQHTHVTRSPAWILGSGHAVIKVDGFSGGYDLGRVTPVCQQPKCGIKD
jgi:hypothetical protein